MLALCQVVTLSLFHNVICVPLCLFLCLSFISKNETKEQKTKYENTNNIMKQRAVAAEEALAAESGKLARVKAAKTRSVEASNTTILKLQLDLDAAFLEHDETEEAREQISTEARERIAIREAGSRGRRISDNFVRHARTLLPTGGSARATLEQLHLNTSLFFKCRRLRGLSGRSPFCAMASIPAIRKGTRELHLYPDAYCEMRARCAIGI